MANVGDTITKSEIISNFIARVKTPAYNTAVFWDTSNPGSGFIDTSQLGPRDVTAPSTAQIPDTTITALTIRNMAKNYAVYTTVYRRARSGYITDNFNPDTAEVTTNDRTDVCRLIDSYQVSYTYSDGTAVQSGQVATASGINGFFDGIRTTAAAAQSSAAVVDLRVCHSSCHSSCHGSRGRR